ncbi:MAG: PilZ domain-containing protein [Bryobacteraceae bacterium]|nr:PilZ domain-containing protein [Bryobacteraceae bacterium]
MIERRAHPRYRAGEYSILRKLESGREISEQVAYITNVSAYGLGVQLDHPISVGSTVTVYASESAFVGSVIYCRRDTDGYAAGLALRCDTDQANQLLARAKSASGKA